MTRPGTRLFLQRRLRIRAWKLAAKSSRTDSVPDADWRLKCEPRLAINAELGKLRAMKAYKAARIALMTFSVALLVGCSSFNRDWNEAPARAIGPYQDINGRWEGYWRSEVNGHHGKLRCLVRQEDDRRYLARYRARCWKIFSFGYTVPLTLEHKDNVFTFKGEADLGKLAGGVYGYEGTASPTNFYSTYRSKYDYGFFRMARPATDN